MRKTLYLLAMLAIATTLIAACGGGGAAQTGGAGDVNAGKALFAQQTIGASVGCITCHSLDGSKLVGPSMQGIGTRAASEVQGQSAEQYVRNSIVDPGAHAPQGYAVGVMPVYKGIVSDTQLNDLVAYLLSLK